MVGETPNLAARLQALAAPGSVVISQATRRLLGGLFELDDLGPRRLKGFAEPLAAWRVEGEGRAEGPLRGAADGGPDAAGRPRARSSRCCCAAGSRPRTARARWCCCPASPGSASRGWCATLRERLDGRAARTPALPMLAAPHDQPAASGDRAAGARGRLRARRSARGAGSTSWRRCWRAARTGSTRRCR